MVAVVLLVGVVGVYAGWHWKLMHRSWQDLSQTKGQAKGKIPALTAARSQHTAKALVFGLFVVVLVIALIH
ncbi:MAG TPA: hypothetical protein VMA97_13410 [Streptosporangiaceae bacterium]|nr:hypothetical protein [Streptosporangiaceae bacterium]